MSQVDDLIAAANICATAADAAHDQIDALDPRPLNPAAAAQWDRKAADISTKAANLHSLAADLNEQAVDAALQALWPDLNGLSALAQDAQTQIDKQKAASASLTIFANAISFGTSLLALLGAPTTGNVQAAAAAFTTLKTSLQPPG